MNLLQLQKHQGYKIACLEEIAYNQAWLSKEQIKAQGESLSKNSYGQYLLNLLKE